MWFEDVLHERKQMRKEQGFLPGLPNDLVLQHIATRVSLSSMYALTGVNSAWRRAIRSREIYNLRKRNGASQQLVVAPVESGIHKGFLDVESQELYLFPVQGFLADPLKSETTHRFPLPARIYNGKFGTAEGIAILDEKLYALQESVPLQEILVLDIALCQREWKRCSSSMTDRRTDIWVPCNGKIFSFHICQQRIHGKFYKPENDQWTEIVDRPVQFYPNQDFSVPHPRARVAVLENKIYVGLVLGKGMMVFDALTHLWCSIPDTLAHAIKRTDPRSSYSSMDLVGDMIVIGDTIHSFSRSCVLTYNPQSNSWKFLSLAFNQNFMSSGEDVLAVACSGNELIGLLASDRELEYKDVRSRKLCRSVGFGVEHGSFVWENVPDFPFANSLGGRAGFLLGHFGL